MLAHSSGPSAPERKTKLIARVVRASVTFVTSARQQQRLWRTHSIDTEDGWGAKTHRAKNSPEGTEMN